MEQFCYYKVIFSTFSALPPQHLIPTPQHLVPIGLVLGPVLGPVCSLSVRCPFFFLGPVLGLVLGLVLGPVRSLSVLRPFAVRSSSLLRLFPVSAKPFSAPSHPLRYRKTTYFQQISTAKQLSGAWQALRYHLLPPINHSRPPLSQRSPPQHLHIRLATEKQSKTHF